ncbi:MAG: SusC/RagA family TonB-linked outer membrane protein [Bacteroidales bacterium]
MIKSTQLFRTLLIGLIILVNQAGIFGQTEKINLSGAPANLQGMFSFIQEKYGYRFFYNNDVVQKETTVNISATEISLAELLKELTTQTGLVFNLRENKLIVVEAAKKQEPVIVKGVVKSLTDNGPLPGVNISIKGTNLGAITDLDGAYTISSPDPNAIVVFTFVGYETQEIPVNGRNQIDVNMVENVENLEEVVVTALNINRTKTSLGYSVSTVKGEDLTKAKENNVINTLSGKVAGLQISKTSTGVDASTRVVLRGVASLLGENRPLIVVDGIPVDGSHGGGGRWGGTDQGDALSDINPEDVESISVLKGAGAAAAYGSRGANGVILISTKKGVIKKGLGVTVTSNYSIEKPLLYPKFQNEYGHGAFGTYPQDLTAANPWMWSYGPKMEGQELPNYWGSTSPYSPQPDNYKDFFQTGSNFINSLALESGNETGSVRASFTTQNSSGLVPTNDLNRQTINLRGFSRVKNILEFDGKVTYIHHKAKNRPGVAESNQNPGYLLSIMPRNMVNDELKNHYENPDGTELGWTSDPYTGNPYWQLNNVGNSDEKHRLQTVFSARANFTKSLNLLVRTGMDYNNTVGHSHTAKGSQPAGINGYISNSMSNGIEWNSDFLLGYNDQHHDNFKFSVSLGGNYRYSYYKSIDQSGTNLKINDFYSISNAGTYWTDEGFSEKKVYSVYGLSTLSFKNWLYFDFTLRNDWSSTLPLESNSYFYHSENLSFVFTDALGIKTDFLTTGKIRTSYSKVGNDTDPYSVQNYYYVSQSQLPYPIGNFDDVLATYDLQPEITNSWEIGTNLNFWSSRLVFDFTYYRNSSENQIMDVPLPASSGFSSKKMNAAHLKNTGFEVQLDAAPIASGDFKWLITLTWSKNKSMVEKLANNLESIVLDESWFSTIQARPGEEYGLIYATDFKRDAFGRKLIDDNGFALKGDYQSMGSINPYWIGGIANTFSYKNLTLSFLIDMKKGGKVYSMGNAYRLLFGTSDNTLPGRADWYATHDPDYLYSIPLPGVEPKGWVEDGVNETTGQPNTVPVDPIYRFYNNWNKEIATESILDATNIRLRELTIGYSLNKSLLERTPVSGVTISFVARNLFFFYNAMEDIDPESGYSSGNTGGGYEHCAIPSARSLGFSLKVDF